VMRRKTLSHHHPSKLHLENAEDWIDGRWGGDKIREISEKAGVLLFSFLTGGEIKKKTGVLGPKIIVIYC
jgi:hypothetical protein